MDRLRRLYVRFINQCFTGGAKAEIEKLKSSIEIGKLQFFRKDTTQSYAMPNYLQSAGYVSTTQESTAYKGWKVLKPFTLRVAAFNVSSTNKAYVSAYLVGGSSTALYAFKENSPQIAEFSFVKGDSICFIAEQTYGGTAAAYFVYQVIDSVS